MNGKGALLLLLVAAGSLIFAGTHQQSGSAPRASPRVVGWMPPPPPRLLPAGGRAGPPKDELAWLGTAPPGIADEELTQRLDAVLTKMMHDVPAGQDTSRFVCKLPVEVGPVPLLEAVDGYLRALPGSRSDPALMRGLFRAAEQGNWLAKVLVFQLLSERRAPDATTAWRTIRLMEWMQENRIGALYSSVGDALAASGYYTDTPDVSITGLDIYAAMHDSYAAQYKVGTELVRVGGPQQAAIGRRMLACAAAALPAYGIMYGGEAVAGEHLP